MKGILRAGAAAALLVAASLATAATGQARELRIGTISAAGSPWDKAMHRFADVVEKETDGEIKVVTYTDGQLGDIQQMLTGMQLGNIEMGYFGLGSALFLKGAEQMKVIYVPYLFRNAKHAEKALNSNTFHTIYDNIAKKTGVRVFAAYGNRSPRAIQTTKGPIKEPEDLKGMKLRIPALDIFQATFSKLGVQSVPMPMTQIYTALSKGVIEGQDNGLDLAIPLKFHEVAKYWSATDHAFETTGWFISEQVWQSLSDKEKTALIDGAREGGKVTTAAEADLEKRAKEIFKKAGVTYTVPDRDAFRAALSDVYKQFEGKDWPKGFIEKVREIGK